MDRTDPPLYAAADPPTVKTEPPGRATDGAREPRPSAGGEAKPAAGSDLEAEPVPASGESEAAAGSDTELEPLVAQPATASTQANAATGSDPEPEPEQSEVQPVAARAEPEPTAGTNPASEPAHPVIAVDNVEPASSTEMEADVASAPPGGSLVADQTPAPARGHPRSSLADWDRERVKSVSVRAAKVAAIVFTAWFTVVIFLIAVYRFVNPPFSSLIVTQWITGTSIHREWAPIERISPNLVRAVIASEDGRFCRHWGIDFAEVAAALKRTSQGVPRGASTITMQVAKNLFLWPAKSYVRKVIEVPLTYAIEVMWSKRRIMEVYLNIAEWGPGVFGAEAAAREHFKRSAGRLSVRQAAQLAVALPNPFQRDAGAPGPWTSRRASVIQRRAARSPEAAACVLGSN